MYSNDKSSVKMENMLTSAFRCHTGVKQGCMFSPTLFNLYLSYLSEELKATNLNDVELNELPLSCTLYTQKTWSYSPNQKTDCTIISLSEYCKENDLSVNLNKPIITNILAYNLVLMGTSRTLNRK